MARRHSRTVRSCPRGQQAASAQGRWITADQKNRGALAVSPSLSPDGRRLAYLSERDMLSVDLYVADAETGHAIRKLVNTAIDPHFSSLLMVQVGLSRRLVLTAERRAA